MTELFRKLLWRVQRRSREAELREELQFHLNEEEEERQAQGLATEQARRAARRELGNVTLVREETRAAWGWPVLEQFGQDVNYAFRSMASNRMFTLMAVISLALGIGAATAIFSVVNAVLLRPLPYRAPDRLVAVSTVYRQAGVIRKYQTVSLNEVEAWRKFSSSLESIGSFVFTAMPVSVGERSMNVVAIGADQELLTTLGVNVQFGQTLSNGGSSRPEPSAILSHKLWADIFHSDPAAIGRRMRVDGELYTVKGVLPAAFQFPRSDASYFPEEPELILPVANIADGWGRDSAQWFAIARLKPGAGIAQAEAEMSAIDARTAKQDVVSVSLSGLAAQTTSSVRSPLLLLLGVSVVLLVIACTNIMNLLFSRATARGREMAVRRAAGATRMRLVRQMLTESACLTALGGISGLLLASSLVNVLVSLFPAHLPVTGHVDIDPAVFGFTFVICAGAVLIAGMFPALHTSLQGGSLLGGGLGSRTFGGRSLARFQHSLTVAQVALGLGLLSIAGLLAHSLLRLSSVNPGFRTEGVLGFEVSVPSDHPRDAMKVLFQRMLEDIRSIPGVISAGWITNLPPETRAGMFMPFSLPGQASRQLTRPPVCNFQVTSEGYFQTIGVPVVRGRDFTGADAAGAPPVVIVNAAFARQYFGSLDALGQNIFAAFDGGSAPRQIVGILHDIRDRGLNTNAIPTAYVPYQQFWQSYGSIAVRANVPLEAIAPEIRGRMARIDPTVPLKNFTTIGARIRQTLGEPRFYALLAGACGLMAILFVTVGLYGVVSYSVSRRTQEIGVRMALGAPRRTILGGVLWQGLRMTALGVAIGLVLALAASRVLTNLLFEVKPTDPLTLGVSAGLVLVVTLAATYLPARRASRVDPMIALRYE